jgi:hypothetical protein
MSTRTFWPSSRCVPIRRIPVIDRSCVRGIGVRLSSIRTQAGWMKTTRPFAHRSGTPLCAPHFRQSASDTSTDAPASTRRPEGGSDEELLAWNARCVTEIFGGQEQTSGAELPHEMTLLGNQDSTAAPAIAAVQAEGRPIEPVPAPGSGPETAASASPPPDPQPSPLAQPVAAEAPVRLPYPFNLMNPADVPEEVWKRARAGQQNIL